jgi:hypothetical protein
MPSDLMLPSGLAPSNLHLRPTVKAKFVSSDVFDICERLAEVDPRLSLWELSEEDKDHAAWLVTENVNGTEMYVKKYQELTPQIIIDVERMRRIPLMKRIEIAQREADESEAELQRKNMEMLIEKVGLPMHRLLAECGFIEHRGRSYAKRGIKVGR